MTDIHLVRHGETIWHAENRYAGVSDVDLSPRGLDQGRRLAAWSSVNRPDRVVSSDLRRAVQTAAGAAERAGATHVIDPRWREVDFGRGEGLTRAEMRERFPADLAAFLAAPGRVPLPGGEVGSHAVERVLPALAAQARAGGSCLVVAHTTLIRLLLCSLLEIDVDRYRSVLPSLANTAITTVRLPREFGDPVELLGSAALLTLNATIGD